MGRRGLLQVRQLRKMASRLVWWSLALISTPPPAAAFLPISSSRPIMTRARPFVQSRATAAPVLQGEEEVPSMLQLSSNSSSSFSVELHLSEEAASSSAKLQVLSDVLIDLGAQAVSYGEEPRAGDDAKLECWWDGDQADSWEDTLEAAVKLLPLFGVESGNNVVRWGEAKPVPMEAEWIAAGEGPGFQPVEVGRFKVVPVQHHGDVGEGGPQDPVAIKILSGMGWGDGRHPTTNLCLDFLSLDGVICGGERVIDYGTGSGVLSIGAIKLGAMECVGVDICYDALSNAAVNTQLNGVADDVDLMHGRTIVPGDFPPADVVIGNILVGTLLALSSVIISLTKPGGWLCLSGIRPGQVDIVKRKYEGQIEWDDRLEAKGEHPTWGWWVRIAGRRKMAHGNEDSWIRALSEASVS